MEDIELVIKGNPQPIITTLKEISKETNKNFELMEKTNKSKIGLIEKEEAILKKLEAWKKKANEDTIAMYNKEIELSRKRLQTYQTVGVDANEKVEKSGNKLMTSMKSWAAGFVSIGIAIQAFKKIMESTDSLSAKFKETLSGWKAGFDQMARAIANSEFKDFFKNVREAVQEGQRFAQMEETIEDNSRSMKIAIAQNETAIINLRKTQNDVTKSEAERMKAGKEAERIIEENAQRRVDLANMILENDIKNAAFVTKQSPEIIKAYLNQDAVLMESIEIGKQYNRLQADIASAVKTTFNGIVSVTAVDEEAKKAIEDKIAALGPEAAAYGELANGLNKLIDTQKDKLVTDIQEIESSKQSAINLRVSSKLAAVTKKDTIDAQKKFQDLSLKLMDEYDKSQIKSFTGKEKLIAQREFGIKQLKELRDQLAALGTLSEDQKAMLQTLADNLWKEYFKALAEIPEKPSTEEQEAISKALLSGMPDLAGIQKSFINTTKGTEFKDFSVWRLLGIDPDDEEGKETIEAIQDAASKIGEALNEALEQRVEIAQRERELLDTKIAETQREIEFEQQLREDGFANNLTARQKYLEDLKKQREAALAAEEKAIKQEQLMGKISQTTNILSGVSNIINTFSKIPVVGLILAAAAVASLFAIWRGAKSQVDTETKLAHGGSGTDKGIISGRRHSQGGERLLDHVNVERGEAFGVLSRQATGKYGKVFHEMVSSFNRNEMPQFMSPSVTNTVRVDNNGPNSRLDKVITEQRRLNESLTKQSQVYNIGSRRVIKKGNKTRIIG